MDAAALPAAATKVRPRGGAGRWGARIRSGSAAATAGRVVFKVTADSTLPADFSDPQVKTMQDKLSEQLTNDIVAEYVTQLQHQLGVVINENALASAEGS